VRDQGGVIVREQRAVALDEVEQVRHLLEVRRHVRVVTPEVGVVELDVDDVLDVVAGRLQVAGARRSDDGCVAAGERARCQAERRDRGGGAKGKQSSGERGSMHGHAGPPS